jgi:hypothetical protein
MPPVIGNAPVMSAPVNAKDAAAGRAVPFVRGAYKSRMNGEARSATLSTAVQSQTHVIPAVGGWNRHIALHVRCVTAGNAANVTFAADGPWNVLTNILLKDAAQKQLVLWSSGYQAYLANLFGAYKQFRPDNSFTGVRGYAATTGAGATGGSFEFTLLLPQEFGRDGTGAYPNMDSSQRLTLDLSINVNANIYGTAPTNPGTLTITPVVYYYSKPAAVAADGMAQETQPPAVGTLQYWRVLAATLDNGANLRTFNLSGRYLRNVFALFTDGSDVRSDSVRPTTTFRAELDNNVLFDSSVREWDGNVERDFGFANPTGFFPIHLGTLDPDNAPGAEWGDGYLRTATSSQLSLKFDTAATGKLYLMLNEIETNGGIFR